MTMFKLTATVAGDNGWAIDGFKPVDEQQAEVTAQLRRELEKAMMFYSNSSVTVVATPIGKTAVPPRIPLEGSIKQYFVVDDYGYSTDEAYDSEAEAITAAEGEAMDCEKDQLVTVAVKRVRYVESSPTTKVEAL